MQRRTYTLIQILRFAFHSRLNRISSKISQNRKEKPQLRTNCILREHAKEPAFPFCSLFNQSIDMCLSTMLENSSHVCLIFIKRGNRSISSKKKTTTTTTKKKQNILSSFCVSQKNLWKELSSNIYIKTSLIILLYRHCIPVLYWVTQQLISCLSYMTPFVKHFTQEKKSE